MRIFLDSDVIFDVLEHRVEFYADSSKIFRLIFDRKCQGYTSPLILSNIFFLFSKYYSRPIAKVKIGYLLNLFTITTINSAITQKAYYSNFTDFEDALQYYSCIDEKIPVIITRNTRDYTNSTIEVYKPGEFITRYYKKYRF